MYLSRRATLRHTGSRVNLARLLPTDGTGNNLVGQTVLLHR